VRWHDGKPFTAQDVKCTFDLLQGGGPNGETLRVSSLVLGAIVAIVLFALKLRERAGHVRHAMEEGAGSQRVDLARSLPVVIYYTTAVVRPDGAPAFYADIYGHDARLERELATGYPYRP